MKHLYKYVSIACCLTAFTVQAQDIVVKGKSVEKVGSSLEIGMSIDISQLKITPDRSVVCTPIIQRDDSTRALPPIIINGRNRHILYERSERTYTEHNEYEIRRKNGTEQTITYSASVPHDRWMDRSEVFLVTDLCGCGWKTLENEKSPLFAINLSQPVALKPVTVYRTPKAETVKARALEGKAYLDFPVNRVEIHPDYRNNPQELKTIRETIESVRDNRYATITEVYIKGYASPEGSYANNTYLAENRAKALRDYVKGLYRSEQARFTVDFEPEDWDGLEKAIVQSDLPDRDGLLAIIRAEAPRDRDAREWKLKKFNGGTSYQTLLREIYPALRHSDYAVKYTIRNFSVEEAKELLYKDPKQLSLNEMFQVAQTYEPGSAPYCEVFEIAVRMFPDDPASNLNAANTAIRNGQAEQAARYLDKVEASPEKQLAEAAIAMLQGELDRAEQLLEPLKAAPAVSEAAINNLKQIEAKRNE